MQQDSQSRKIKNNRWYAYAAAGAAATLAGAQSAEADITHIVVGSPGGDIGVGDDLYFSLAGSAALNLFNVDLSSSSPGVFGAMNVGVFNGGSFFGTMVGFSSAGFNYASNLAPAANISTQNFLGSSVFATMVFAFGYTNEQFIDTGGFLAFRFDAGAGTQFGWARVSSNGDSPANTFVLEEYAFGDVGEAVSVGQTASIPEPASLGLLAMGAVGLLANRRRRSASASA